MNAVILRKLGWLCCLWLVFSSCASKAEHDESGPRIYRLPSAPNPGPSDAWPMTPERAEYLFSEGELRILSREDAGGGVTGASRMMLYSPEDDLEFKAKWKEVPYFLESWNNSPRRELAAYAVQKIFLDPPDYVVPTAALRCITLERYREYFPKADPTLKNSKCVLGMLALWINNVTIESQLLDPERFSKDPNYAYHLANFNVLTFLIDHKDGRSNNFLVSKNDTDRHVFAIDNGISFDAWIWNWFVPNWNTIRVPALNRKAVDRLRQVKAEDIARLGAVAELRMDGDGIYRTVEPGAPLEADEGVRTAPGVVQFGLTTDEVDDVREQVEEIVEMVDEGEVPVF
jgi:hypothetical protein